MIVLQRYPKPTRREENRVLDALKPVHTRATIDAILERAIENRDHETALKGREVLRRLAADDARLATTAKAVGVVAAFIFAWAFLIDRLVP